MPDITMCLNNQCPLRFNCERYTAKPNLHKQSYVNFQFEYAMLSIPKCKHFVNNEKYNLGA